MFRLLSLVALTALAASASAQTCTTSWSNASDGDWSDDANWSDGAPEAGDTACITEPGTYTVTLDRDQELAELVVGGSSGTQTLLLDGTLAPLGAGTIGPNGVIVIENSANCGDCDGLPNVTGTLTVEGTLVHRNGVGLLSQGGTVDIAPGGTLRVRTGINSAAMGSGTGVRSRIVVRGTLFFDAEGGTGRSMGVRGDLDLAGGTIAATNGRIDFSSQGTWTGGTFDVPENGFLWFLSGNGSTGIYEATGTFTGAPVGRLEFGGGSTLTAGTGGATLEIGGTGIVTNPGSGQSTFFRSAGGAFTNTGRVEIRGNGLRVNDVTLRNEGELVLRSTLRMEEGAVVDNQSSGEVALLDGAGITGGADGGTLRSRGRVSARLDASGGANSTIGVPVDFDGATVEVASNRLQFSSGGALRDVEFDVAQDRAMWLTFGEYAVTGTLSGTPVGSVEFTSGSTLTAGTGGVTLAFGGTGVSVTPGSGQSTFFRSSGGTFTNTGQITVRGNGLWINDATLRNQGRVNVESTLRLEEDATFDNRGSGDLVLSSGGSIRGGSEGGRLIGRGRIAAVPNGRSSITVPVDLDGATVQVTAQGLQLSGGALRDVAFDVAENSTLSFTSSNGEGLNGVFEIGGTLTGDIGGSLTLSSGGSFAGAEGGGALAFGGTGLLVSPGSGQSSAFTSRGGRLMNTGLVTIGGNGLRVREGIVSNEGTVRVQTRLFFQAGGTFVNSPGGIIDFQGGGSSSSLDGSGQLTNEGLILSSGNGRSAIGELRGRPGSEVRVLEGAEAQIFAPGSASIPAGAALTGTGRISDFTGNLFIEGDISPGTDEAPIGTLTYGPWTFFSSATGVARLVIDVDETGSDVLETVRGPGPAGSVRLGGTLFLRVADGYTPQPGDTFTVLRTTNATNDIVGDFDLVVSAGAPDGIGFVTERNATNTEVIVRVVEVEPGGPIVVSASSLVGGGERQFFLTGPGVTSVTGARLECTSCLDPQAAGTVEASLRGDDAVGLVAFDLTSPRAFGFYDLVLSREALPDTTLPFVVRPFLSFALIRESVLSGAGVRPDKGNPSYLQLLVNGNSPVASYPFYVFDYPEPVVEWSLDSQQRLLRTAARVFEDEEAGRDLTFVFGAVPPSSPVGVVLAQRLDPSDVLFPDQEPTGPDDDRVPFGEGFVIRYASSNHMSLERMAEAFEAGLRGTGALTAFLASVDAGDPGAVSDATANMLSRQRSYIADPSEGLAIVLGELGASQALIEAAEAEFFDALDAAGGTVIAQIAQASNDAVNTAPADVRDLFLEELADLGDTFDGVALDDLMPGAAEKQSQQGRRVTGTTGNIPIPPSPFGGCGSLSNAGTTLTGNNLRAVNGVSSGGSSGGAGGGAGSGACGPYDPNDKTTTSPYLCELGTVVVDGEEVPRCVRYFVPLQSAEDVIPYQIAFENLPEATAAAEFVTITDVLDPSLDPSTLEVYGTSSDSTFSYTVEGQVVTFRFTGIDLPPNVEAPEGEGFVSFGVRPRTGLAPGTEIRNEAGIVFDFNPPIETPAVIHELRETADLGTALDAPEEVEEGDSFAFEVLAVHTIGDPVAEATLTISAGTPIATAVPTEGTCSGQGTGVVTCALSDLQSGDVITVAVELDDPPSGTYTLSTEIASAAFDAFPVNDSDAVTAGVVGVSVEDDVDGLPREVRLARVAPNPVHHATTLRWGVPTATAVDLRVYDLRGREVAVLSEGERVAAGWHETTWRPDLASGVYLVRLMAGTEVRTKKLVVIR